MWKISFSNLSTSEDARAHGHRTSMPRAVAYFWMLRRTNYVNAVFVLIAVPQIIQVYLKPKP